MWLPLRSVLEFLGRSAAWLVVVLALAAAAALVVTLAARRSVRSWWPAPFWAAVVGALLGASLADRFNLPEPLTLSIWRRSLPLAWAVGGALLGAVVAIAWTWAAGRRRPQPAGPAGGEPA